MDRLRAYEVFVTVVSRGSFTKAANALDTSPANVTRYINELEAHLRTRLMNRTSRRLSLTEGGEALFDRAKLILEEVAETEALATTASLQPRGRLRITAPLSFGSLVLAPMWPKFMAEYPDVELDIALIDRVVDIVEEGYDLAIRISRATSGNHIARRLGHSQNLVCASPEYHMACPRSLRTSLGIRAWVTPTVQPPTSGSLPARTEHWNPCACAGRCAPTMATPPAQRRSRVRV